MHKTVINGALALTLAVAVAGCSSGNSTLPAVTTTDSRTPAVASDAHGLPRMTTNDNCDGSTCSVTNPGGGGGGTGGGGGGGGAGNCYAAPRGHVKTMCGGEGNGGGNTNDPPVVAINKVAQYGDQCTKDSEFVGHPVAGFSDSSHGITQEYPIAVHTTLNAANVLIGYVYTTVGGNAYFEPVGSAVGAVVTINATTSIYVGPNGLIKGANSLTSSIASAIRGVMKKGSPAFGSSGGSAGDACFEGGDWNGKVTS